MDGSSDFFQVLITVLAFAPASAFIAKFFPATRLPMVFFWLLAFSMDAFTTSKFYRLDSDRFILLERNKVFAAFVERLGFTRGLTLFLLAFEIPMVLLFGAALMPVVQVHLTCAALPDFAASIASAFAVVGLMHFHAAVKNMVSLRASSSIL